MTSQLGDWARTLNTRESYEQTKALTSAEKATREGEEDK